MGDRGIALVFVGYADNHSTDCYHMWYPSTRKITESHDIIWLHRMYFQGAIDNNVAILPAIRVEVPEMTNYEVMSIPNESRTVGGVDPVSIESDIENELES